MLSNSRTVAEVLVEMLKEAGVELVFGLPGGENVEVMEALRREGVRFVLVRNESSAVFMADVHTRLSGKPGVCLTTLGPGATNAYVGVAHAYLDRAPVMLITAETNQRYLPHHTHQVYNLQDIFRPVTKLTESITPKTVKNTVRNALRLMREGRPRPVHLSLSREMAAQVAQVADVGEINDEMPSLWVRCSPFWNAYLIYPSNQRAIPHGAQRVLPLYVTNWPNNHYPRLKQVVCCRKPFCIAYANTYHTTPSSPPMLVPTRSARPSTGLPWLRIAICSPMACLP